MKTNEKWFYPIQENLLNRLHSEYNRIDCMYQEVLKTKVFESYTCWNSLNEQPVYLLAVLNKITGRFHLYQMIEK
jgi:hypothetical protein